jgi:hypothetical protein
MKIAYRLPFGFRCGDGWFHILWQLCQSLEPLVRDLTLTLAEPFEIKSVKQKLGSLRVYVSHHTPEIDALRGTASQESLRTCVNSVVAQEFSGTRLGVLRCCVTGAWNSEG